MDEREALELASGASSMSDSGRLFRKKWKREIAPPVKKSNRLPKKLSQLPPVSDDPTMAEALRHGNPFYGRGRPSRGVRTTGI